MPNHPRNRQDLRVRARSETVSSLSELAPRCGFESANTLASELIDAGLSMLQDAADPPPIPVTIANARHKLRHSAALAPPLSGIPQTEPSPLLAAIVAQAEQIAALTTAVAALAAREVGPAKGKAAPSVSRTTAPRKFAQTS